MYNHFECLDSSLCLIMCIIFKGHREEEDVEDEGVLDPSQELIEEAELLMIGDNEKARLFKGFLARHFFRGMVSVSSKQYTLLQSPLRNLIKNLNNKFFIFSTIFPLFTNSRFPKTSPIVLFWHLCARSTIFPQM